ncbi:hypothetical protein ES695_08845 [Candidatus Atribacteria bacterium 1244-E10-H5-B2]|nr:MAG: hypothetical protein ES695_08845 [Candidatus Atribacteria bacterium 1244-E10-H5-B2]
MKVQIKDLKPNPFRDMKNYPINQEKIQSLTNSINQTGFWDNILARKNNGNIEIAYGHHRLVVLKKLFKPDDYVDIPMKELDDSTMIKIMANENDESWGTNPKIIDETVKTVRKYLFHHGEAIKTKTPKKNIDYFRTPLAFQIHEFLNGNWSEIRVYLSLERLGLIERGELDKEAIELLPTERSARDFVKATKQIKNVTPEQQREAAKNIIRNQSFGESSVKSALLDEKYKDMETEKSEREKVRIKARDFVHGIAKDLEKINEKIEELIKRKSEPNFDVYEDCIEAEEFTCEVKIFIGNIKKLGGKK